MNAAGRPDEIESADPLIVALAGGGWVSGPALAAHLGVTRSAVSARIARLRRTGIDVYAVSGKGYRLAGALDLLDAKAIRAGLSAAGRDMLDQLIVRQSVDSTNSVLGGCRDGATRACLAEYQTAGRGRAGRAWISPFAANLYLSVGYDLVLPRAPVATISLAVGVALAEALADLGVADIGLKWPNDLWIGRDKLGGILTEVRGEVAGMARLVVGLGLNIAMPRGPASAIDQPWTRLVDHAPPGLTRSRVAGRCLDAVLAALTEFETRGFEPFAARWPRYDRVAGQPVDLVENHRRTSAIAQGVADDGSLLVEIDGARRAVYAGDISLRLVAS
ncbi:biotin--[acetyl-CoA-carboxylase] ligase [Salinisphaera sp.]|uniref:biotin--[acetyl-CoA-carboxylase] ligase n=1 Tax=Salinisphaera sp. TaxID=1914330 RepID=UPI002D76EA70|nr:biotin--[acetyl-CoA-carboxylase] ligase [Salinisphaera sp.]HET7313712.1 biotin--[acetyl-CoA-carboxylase] ligase [Salinisphaera sp.]